MSEGIPQITICEGCTEAPALRQINDVNASYVGYTAVAKEQIARVEAQITRDGDTSAAQRDLNELRSAVAEALEKAGREAEVVERVNDIDFCEPGKFCARELCYRHSGGSAPIQDPRYQNPGQ